MAKESHLSTERGKVEKAPLPLHKRLAMGDGNGKSNPNGGQPSKDSKVARGGF